MGIVFVTKINSEIDEELDTTDCAVRCPPREEHGGMPQSDREPKNTRLDKITRICYTVYRPENGLQARASAAPITAGHRKGSAMSRGLTTTDTLLSATRRHGKGVLLKVDRGLHQGRLVSVRRHQGDTGAPADGQRGDRHPGHVP